MALEYKEKIEGIIKEILEQTFFVPVGVSNKHVHLSREALDALFGKGYELGVHKEIVQPGQFAAKEKVDIMAGDRMIKGVRVLGPLRDKVQVEISKTDARSLRIDPPIRESGHLEGSAPITLIGPNGKYTVNEGVIIASRHIHAPTDLAEKYGLKDHDICSVEIGGERGMVLKNVLMRVSDGAIPEFHVDVDEANAANLGNGDYVKIIN